jgi:protein-tyrosine phosphatase
MLTNDDKHRLKTMGLRTVIDLRFAGELTTAPNVYANAENVCYCHMPLHEDRMQHGISALPRDLEAYYLMLIDHAGPQLCSVIERLAQHGALPAVVHCTLGKDRTGLVVALMLDLLGVPHELIVQDYALTAHYGGSLLSNLREKVAAHGQHAEWHQRMLACELAAMNTALEYLKAQFGSAALYLMHHGMNPRALAKLRAGLLER